MSRVLVIDDEPALCWTVQELLTDRGHEVEAVSSVEQARLLLDTFQPNAIILDVRLPGEDGLSALPEFRRRCPDAPVIVITAFGDLPTAVKALGRGAFDYLVKPFDLAQFAKVVERALTPQARSPLFDPSTTEGELVGRSQQMQGVFRQIALVAPTHFPVLLVGETGTGKEVAARAIHQHSPCASGPFVPVCLAALNPAVIESELFGHVRGAFTGAADSRVGLFEQAENGTIFLDEIAETPPNVQVKLLRVLESRRFCPVGSGVERTTNARFIAATHRNLPEMLKEGTFREDLYHRLKVFTVALPALRERREDLRPLVEYFLCQLDDRLRPSEITDDFWNELESRVWPGNVRELRHAIDHAAVLARGGALRPEHLPQPEVATAEQSSSVEQQVLTSISQWVRRQLDVNPAEPGNLHRQLMELVESKLFEEVLTATRQNRTAAAKLLGLDRATLRTRLRQLTGNDDD